MKIVNNSNNPLPEYSHKGDSGMDLRANLGDDTTLILLPGKRTLVPTGIHIQLPEGFEGQVRPRSGLAIKHGVVAQLGTIDQSYVGDIGVILINHGHKPFKIKNGDRIAQLVISKVYRFEMEEVDSLEDTTRGNSGFGSTGLK